MFSTAPRALSSTTPGVGCINPPALRQQRQTHVPLCGAARGHDGAVPGIHVDAPKTMQKMEGALPQSLFLAMDAMDEDEIEDDFNKHLG